MVEVVPDHGRAVRQCNAVHRPCLTLSKPIKMHTSRQQKTLNKIKIPLDIREAYGII
jgi:hypothetical protein